MSISIHKFTLSTAQACALLLACLVATIAGFLAMSHRQLCFTDCQSGLLDRSGNLTLLPKGLYAIAGPSAGLITYLDMSSDERPGFAELLLDSPNNLMPESWSAQGGLCNLEGTRHPLRNWYVTRESVLSEGLVCVKHKTSPEYVYVHLDGRQAIPKTFSYARHFSEGLAAVSVIPPATTKHRFQKEVLQGRWGFIDRNGTFMIPPRYVEVSDFHHGLAIARLPDDSVHILRKDGSALSRMTGCEIEPYSQDGFALVREFDAHKQQYGASGIVNSDGRYVRSKHSIHSFAEGLGLAEIGNKVTILDSDLNTLRQTQIDRAALPLSPWLPEPRFSDGLAPVTTSRVSSDSGDVSLLGFMTRRGELLHLSTGGRVITACTPFSSGISIVKTYNRRWCWR